MKSNTAFSDDVLVHGARESGNFSIAANGKAFKILIDGLYSNKIQAIIRELSSNAFDAQIAARRSALQFEMQLPNLLDPSFSVRDYGTSLSHEDIMGLYTTVFHSTKENSNDEIGKFGLGSKTPFAYTDSFTVTAFLRGTKRVYGAYINPQGIPQISLMASETTSELDGLMVSFPVNGKDCGRFRLEAERVIEGFDVKPKVRGDVISLETRGEPIFIGSNFKIFGGNGNARAKQGCVIYPIDINTVNNGWSQTQQDILRSNILIDFPIGQLDITPSRETLSYDDVTIANILAMTDVIHAEIIAEYETLYSAVKTMYEARCFVDQHQNSRITAVSNFANKLTFNGKNVNPFSSMERDRIKKVYNVGILEIGAYALRHTKTLKFSDKEYTTDWNVTSDTMFLIEDCTRHSKRINLANARIRNNLGSHTNIVWIRDYGATPKQWRHLKKLLGYPPKFYHLKDFNPPERRKPDPAFQLPRIARNELRVEKLVGEHFNKSEDVIDLNNLDKDTCYILSHKGMYVPDENNYGIGVNSVKSYFDDVSHVIVIKNKNLARVKKAGLVNGLAKKRDELAKIINFKSYNYDKEVAKEMNHWIKDYAEILTNLEYKRETSFKKVLDFVNRYDKKDSGSQNDLNIGLWKNLVSRAEFNDMADKHPATFEGENTLRYWVSQLVKDYPLLKRYVSLGSYDNGDFDGDFPEILNYINMVDKEKGI
jgi:hypothetical protein